MNLIISQPLQLIVLEYLTQQPYKDVAGLIQQLQRLQPAVSPATPEPAKIQDIPPGKNGEKATGDKKVPDNTAV